MNGFFLFMSQELGLGSPIEMLGSALVRELLPGPLSFSEEEYYFLSEYDRKAGLEPLVLGGYLAIPPTRVIALSHPGFMAKLIDSFHIVSAHAPNCLVPRYLREKTQ